MTTTTTSRRPQTSAPADGARTITLRDTERHLEDDAAGAGDPNAAIGVLKLRGAQRRTRQHVAWDADVVDNEGCGKKKSKICCLYHKPRQFDESSSSSDESDAGSDSDSGSDRSAGWRYRDARARPTRRHPHPRHAHGRGCGHKAVRWEEQGVGTVHEQPDSGSDVNAYERAPKRKS